MTAPLYAPLHAHSYWSTLDGLTSPQALARRAVRIGAPAVALTDHGSVAGVPSALRAAADACGVCGHPKSAHADNGKGRCLIRGEVCGGYTPANLKLLAGCEFYVCAQDSVLRTPENRPLSHLVCVAKNLAGWRSMLRAVSLSNSPEHSYYKPRLNLERLAEFAGGNWLVVTGHPGSTLADFLFVDRKSAYRAKSVDEARGFLKDGVKDAVVREVGRYHELFGRENVKLEVQLMDADNLPAVRGMANLYRWAAAQTGGECVATPDAHYAERADAPDQRVLLCGAFKTTLARVQQDLDRGEDVTLGGFFKSNNYHLPSPDEMLLAGHLPGELDASLRAYEMCEPFDLRQPPRMPAYETPGGASYATHMRDLCEAGLRAKLGGLSAAELAPYRAQLDREFAVFDTANLHQYFLVVQDICRHSREALGCPRTPGRGSAAGTLTGFLLDIHHTDPIRAKLSFERFYNAGRNSPGKVAMPDIDMDFPVARRGAVIEYIRAKYGVEKVAQIATFSTLQGRQALTQVLAAHSWGGFTEWKEITKRLPDEASIADKLQEMREEEGRASIIEWALRHTPDEFREFAVRDEATGEITGTLGTKFAQAIRIEGCKRGSGKHASGVIVSPVPLGEVCPLLFDKSSGHMLAGMEYEDLEQMGLVKLDVLGVAILDKMLGFAETAERGVVSPVGDFDPDDEDGPDGPPEE
jgi:DNA polymerase III subunit alpha